MNALLGFKLGQSQTFTSEGKRIPVTKIDVRGCTVTGVDDTPQNCRIQIAIGTSKHMDKPVIGQMKKAGLGIQPRFLRSFPVSAIGENEKPGAVIQAQDVFTIGDTVQVTGISKGKGFAGGVKRHHFKGGPRTHGQSDRERAPGSIGQTTTPGRVYRGKRMAGRLGNDKVTVRNLTVVALDPETQTISVKGLIPGRASQLVIIRKLS